MANPVNRIVNRGNLDRFAGIPENTKTTPTVTIGAPGFQISSGQIVTQERNSKLIGDARYRTYSDILANVSIVAAGVRYFTNLVAKAGWIVEPAESETFTEAEREEALLRAEQVESMLYDMEQPWSRIVRRAAGYKFYGFSVAEWTAKRRDDGLIGLLDIAARPQATIDRWGVDKTGSVVSIVQRSPQTGEEIVLPRGKCVYAVDDSISDSPEGMGLLRHLVEPAERLQRYQLLEGIAFDTELRGIPVIYAPLEEIQKDPTMSAEQKLAATTFCNTFLSKHARTTDLGLMFDSSVYRSDDDAQSPSSAKKWWVELVQGNGSGTVEVATAIERLNREMARIMGVEGLLLGGEKVGSMALSQDKSQNFALTVDSTLTELAEVFTRDILVPIFILNGWDEQMVPTLKTDQTQYRDVEQITRALADMAQSGAMMAPGDPAIDAVRDLLGIPRPPEVDLIEQSGIRTTNPDGTTPIDSTAPGDQQQTNADLTTPVEDPTDASVQE